MAELAASERRGSDPWNDRPELWPELSDVWAGWWQLSAERGEGASGPLRLGIAAMQEQLDAELLTDAEARGDRIRWWREMDGAYFEWLKGQREESRSGHAVPGDER